MTGTWARCPGCDKERQVISGRMKDHRRWDGWNRVMIRCDGSGQAGDAA